MRILCLYNNKCALPLFEWIEYQGNECILWEKELDVEWCEKQNIDLTVSYTYSYILKENIICALKENVVNLHTSFLPYNRGSYPNIWSIMEGTPRGVTLHYINSEIDKGDIIAQKVVPLKNSATLRSSYEQLDREAKGMFADIFLYYDYWRELRKKCSGKGTYHTDKEFEMLKSKFDSWDWDMSVQKFLLKIGKGY